MRDFLLAARLWHRAMRYRHKLNRGEIAAMRTLLPRGGVGLDVGAHKGAYSWWMAKAVGRSGTVLAFEPQERVVRPTLRAFAVARLPQVKYIQAAVTDRSGQGEISVRRSSTHGASLEGFEPTADIEQVPVRLLALDEYADGALDRVDFIKIDVEGHEVAVLRGARRLIERFRPAILVECEARKHEGQDALGQVRALLEPLGYRAEFFTARTREPIERFDPAVHQRYGHGYFSNNFLFTCAGRPAPPP